MRSAKKKKKKKKKTKKKKKEERRKKQQQLPWSFTPLDKVSVKNNNAEVVLSALTLRVRREGRKEGEEKREGTKEKARKIVTKVFLPWQTK